MTQTVDRSITAPQRGGARLAAALLALMVAGCEQEVEAPPPALPPAARAEVEVPGAADFEQAYPITAEDVGDLVLASGRVVENPGPEGFFLQTEGGQVIFVRAREPANAGQMVRAVGPVRLAEPVQFQGWERDLREARERGREMVRPFYIDATRVVPIAGP